jgi:hypothetical protein
MSKTNTASKPGHATLEDHRPLADSELDVASGGTLSQASRELRDSELDTVVSGTSNSDWISWTRLLAPPIPYPGSNPGSNKGA